MDYEKDMTIDESALDVEWLDQPRLMLRYAKHAAKTRLEVERVKEKLDIVRAELDKKIRMDPEAFEIVKLTETFITSTILTQKEYQEANEEYLEAVYESNMAQGAVRAIDGKKTALENLVRLHGQQYFAGPSVPRDLSKEWEDREKQQRSDAGVASKLKRTKNKPK